MNLVLVPSALSYCYSVDLTGTIADLNYHEIKNHFLCVQETE